MKNILLILVLFWLSGNVNAQFNDTIFYKSGMEKVVEISEFTDAFVKFTKVNSKGESVNSQVAMNVVLRYVMYDEDGVLQYDSRAMSDKNTFQDELRKYKYPATVSVSKHQLSVNPFALPFLSFSGKYNYRFGNKMQYSICSRGTFLSPIIDNIGYWGNVMIGAGFQLAPFYNNRFAFGLDFTPMVGLYTDGYDDITIMFPLSIDFDFYFSEFVGISADFGFGQTINDGDSFVGARGHLGVLIQFKDKTTFDTGYNK